MAEESALMLTCEPLKSARAIYDEELPSAFAATKYLYLDVCSEVSPDASPVVNFEFWQEQDINDEPDLTIRLTCLPKVRTRLIVPFSALDAQKIFLRRTPGVFRGFVTGRAVDPGKIKQFAIGLREYWSEQSVTVYEIGLMDELPESPVPEIPCVDELGQWTRREWEGKSGSIQEVTERLHRQLEEAEEERKLPNRSAYGGWTELKFEATGYFRVDQKDGRYYLVDPDGYAFFSAGLDETSPSIRCPAEVVKPFFSWLPDKEEYPDAWTAFWGMEVVDFLKVNLWRAFGKNWFEPWLKITKSLFSQWGFNTIGNFSEVAGLPEVKTPYVKQLMDFPSTKKLIYRDFPDVFSDEYKENSAEYAQQLKVMADDRYLIGYFMRNEPQWGFAENLEVSAELLANPDRDLITKQVFMDALKEKYGSVSMLNAAWGTTFSSFDALREPFGATKLHTADARADLDAFSYRMIREYVRVPAEALREVDPHHLNLGMRYAFILYPNQCAGKEFLDIFSINCYKIDPGDVLRQVTDAVQMPVMIGEFHFGSIDKGLGSTGIIGVRTQKDRGLAYQRYLEACATNPYCVGAHWYTLYDQFCLGRFDGENYQIGLLDICNHPYEDFIKEVVRTHERLYPLIAGQIEPEHPEPSPAKSNIAS